MRMNKDYTVYMHITPSNKVYIGITSVDVERRWQGGRNYKTSPHFNSAIKKYGWKNIRHEILFTNLTKEQAEKKEIELISFYNSTNPNKGYNIENGGNSTGKLSEETKKKISMANKGKNTYKRRCHTEEEKKRVSEKLKGRTSPMKGKHWSESQRARVGTAIVCLETGEVFYSLHDAQRKTGIDRCAISKVIKGIYKQTGGMHFEYAKK